MEKITKIIEKDKILLEQIIADNVSLLFGEQDKLALNLFIDKIMDRISSIDIFDWKLTESSSDPFTRYGSSEILEDGRIAVKLCGTNNYKGHLRNIERVYSYEIWKILMIVLNSSYGSYFSRTVSNGSSKCEVKNYAGFLICDDGRVVGKMMADSLAQVLSLVIQLNRTGLHFIIDDFFKNNMTDEDFNFKAFDLLPFFYLFVGSFKLIGSNWMDKNYDKGKGLLEGITIKDSLTVQNNIFISESFRNPIAVMDEYDRYTYKGAYVSLMSRIDDIYNDYLENGYINVKGFIKIARELKNFFYTRLYDYLDKGKITKDVYEKISEEFDQVYASFKEKFHVFKITARREKFKKRVNNVLNRKM